MFDFFRKKKEIKYSISVDTLLFFENLVKIIPAKYRYLELQINNDFLLAFIPNILGFKNSFTFHLNAKLESKYINKKLPHYFILKGIKVWHNKLNKFVEIELDILSGYFGGFQAESIDFANYDFSKFDISNINEKHFENKDLDKVLQVFNESDQIFVKENIGYTYEIKLKEGKFYFFEDIDNGDVFAINISGDFYALLHDPYQVKLLFSKDEFIDKLKNGTLKNDAINLL